MPRVSREAASWRALALTIPDEALRQDALQALQGKRANIDGAALFTTLATTRSLPLLRFLVAFEVLADYLDCASERAADAGIGNGLQLHRALRESLDQAAPLSDYYTYHPWHADGGYAQALVERCRETVVQLPSFADVRGLAVRAAELAQVLAVNHEPDPDARDSALAAWAAANFPGEPDLAWFEKTAAASAWLTVLALVAVAADHGCSARTARAVSDAYLPWVSLAGTMLDSYSDLAEDRTSGAHSYLAHYGDPRVAVDRLGTILRRAFAEAGALEGSSRHLVLVSCMVAMYLSKDSALRPCSRRETRALAHAAGPLPKSLLPIVRCWRIAYGQQADGADRGRGGGSRLPRSAPAPAMLQTLAFWRDPHAYLAWCARRYGHSFTIRAVGMAPLVFLSKAEDIKQIVRAPAEVLHPGAGAAVIAPLVGEGSFMLAEEDAHLAGRRAILPAFHHSRVRDHALMISETVKREVAGWPRDQAFAIHPYLRRLSLRIILQTVFGTGHPQLAVLHPHLLSMLSITPSLALQEPELRRLPPWRGLWQRFLRDRTIVYELLDTMIAEEAHAHARRSGLLAMLLDGEHPDPRQVREDLMSVILAGHETTASELAWAFQLLAHDQRAARLFAASVDAGDGRYAAATVREVLRHRPVFLFTIPRVVARPLKLGGHCFRLREQLVGCIHLMHHDPELYDDPDRFRPERFLDGEPPRNVWMPWGGGRKRCPGHHLATLEMELVLQIVLQEFHILPAAKRIETARWRSVIVTPEKGSRVILRRRTKTVVPRNIGWPPFF